MEKEKKSPKATVWQKGVKRPGHITKSGCRVLTGGKKKLVVGWNSWAYQFGNVRPNRETESFNSQKGEKGGGGKERELLASKRTP